MITHRSSCKILCKLEYANEMYNQQAGSVCSLTCTNIKVQHVYYEAHNL